MSAVDIEEGRVHSTRPTSKEQPAAWVEDEMQELSLSSTSASSSDERQKKKGKRQEDETTLSKATNGSPIIKGSQVIVKAEVNFVSGNVEMLDKDLVSSQPESPINSPRDESERPSTQRQSNPELPVTQTATGILKIPDNKTTTHNKTSLLVSENKSIQDMLSLNSRRMSVGDSSLDGSRSITSQSHSEARSYRDRLKDRYQTVKERAGNIKTETKSQKRINTFISNQRAAQLRVSELLKKEELELEAALEKHQNSQSRKKTSGTISDEATTVDTSIDFFTRVWDSDPFIVGSPVRLTSQEEEDCSPSSLGEHGEEQLNISGGDKTKLLAADYLGFSRDEWEVVDHSVGPAFHDELESGARESELYFYPTGSPALEDRLGSGKEVRYREEEGLYVGYRPRVRASNCHRLERRLLKQGARCWFGDDGELNVLPDPIRSAPYRPPEYTVRDSFEVDYIAGGKPHIYQSNLTSEGVSSAVLEIHIGAIEFQHHPLFSPEHVLAQRLFDLYKQYRVRETAQQEERLAGRLNSLRQAYDSLQIILNSDAANITSQQLDRMQMYKKEIRSTWRHLLLEGRRSRQLLVSLLSSWRDLKSIRDSQGYTCTPHRLLIHREKMSQKEMLSEKAKWEGEIRQACGEIEMEEQQRYNEEWEQYQTKLEAWRKQHSGKGKSPGQKPGSSSTNEVEIGTEEQTTSDRTSQIIGSTIAGRLILLKEPEEPTPVDSSKIRDEVLDNMTCCLRPPGEPKLKLSFQESEKIDDHPKDLSEKKRRNSLKRCQLCVRIFYNNKEVCKTQSYHLNSKFKVAINECFTIKIQQPPESIHLSIVEDGAGGGRHHLAQVFLPIPAIGKTLKSSLMDHYEFSSDRIVSFSHAGVGSGTFISGSSTNGCLYTSGVISCRAGWGIDNETKLILAPQQKYLTLSDSEKESSYLLAELGKDGILDVTKLTEWAQKSQLDPNDPSNASFFYLIKTLNATSKRESDYFRLNPLLRDFDFCDTSALMENLRLRLLTLRAQGEIEFRDWKLVPNREKEIPADIFKPYEKRVSASVRETEFDVEMTWSDPLSSHRAWGRLYLERVYQRVLAQCRQAQRTASLHHIVAEDQVPDISTLGLTFMKWLQPKRPLRPLRKERKKVAVQSLAGQEVRLMVNVIRAFEVPVRKTTDSLLGSISLPSSTNLGFATVAVRPFVEISFQGSTLRTTTAEGANPTWNQDLQMPVRPGSSESDTLFIHLFDEVIVDLVEDDRIRETSIHQRLERNWLASLHIPFTTLVHNARIEGTFKMYSPPMLLGYERESHQRTGWQSGTFPPDQTSQLFPNRDATFINLFITVQPALNPPEPFNERLDSSEVYALEEHLLYFEKEMDALVPHRRIKTLVIDASGKSVCITRFFRPLAPPALSSEDSITEDMAARFVSMVPVAPSQGVLNVWLTCDQVLRLGWGDAWAHAVLLCCYLLGLGKKAYLLIGTGIPHGQTAYVLVLERQERHKMHYWVWDPTAGQRYSIFDSFCPLQRVFGLVNDENIWINLQKEELPRRTQFDLNRRSDWMAAFGRRGSMSAPVGSVQPASLQYSPASPNAAITLQDKLEKFLRDSLMKWRRTKVTLWNRYCIATLRKVLPRLEHVGGFGSGENTSPHHTRELHHILASHKVCGFPINLPYTTVEAIVEAVRATGVHLNQDENAEFALAVYVHPFPNNILSIWIYVASLTKLR